MRISDWSSDVCSSDLVDSFLDTRDLPPPDLIVRTSGEVRLSNFMLWQAAYAELLFVDTLWPDFDADALAAAVESFAGRDRRYGRSEEHTSELQSLMRNPYAVFCLNKKTYITAACIHTTHHTN